MIRVQNLSKSFGPKIAVNGVSFTVNRGEVLGFLGPNGAGKSTTMRMITGFIPPTKGDVTIESDRSETDNRLSAGKRAVLRRYDGNWLSEFRGGATRLSGRGEN